MVLFGHLSLKTLFFLSFWVIDVFIFHLFLLLLLLLECHFLDILFYKVPFKLKERNILHRFVNWYSTCILRVR